MDTERACHTNDRYIKTYSQTGKGAPLLYHLGFRTQNPSADIVLVLVYFYFPTTFHDANVNLKLYAGSFDSNGRQNGLLFVTQPVLPEWAKCSNLSLQVAV
jgi:hypothetical protein